MIRIRQIKIPILDDNEVFLKNKVAKILHINVKDIKSLKINRKSIDARLKDHIFYIYEVDVDTLNAPKIIKKNTSKDIFQVQEEQYKLPKMKLANLKEPIVVVGTGPAGLFASYILAATGLKPLIIERGQILEERIKDVEKFWKENLLNTESNVQFGEGGAGTFSDGKLNTLIKDPRHLGKLVMEVFVKHGAPPEIMYLQHPHIGTDNLRLVIKNMRETMLKMGAKYLFKTKLTNLLIEDGKLKAIEVNNQEIIPCSTLILAIGHSARDTLQMLYDKNLKMEAKPFAMGIRIMHEQEFINQTQYGKMAKYLPPANYKLTYKTKENRGVYSFCMCPGGYVVNASSEKNHLAINGMSNYKRDSKVANSALVVTINPNDFGSKPLDGLHFQKALEEKAYKVGQSLIPLQNYEDYQNSQPSHILKGNIALKGHYTLANIQDILPDFMNKSIIEAMDHFDQVFAGFKNKAVIAALESRTSSPVRIIRDENMESNIKGIFPCGEGAGYAGGITTSAIDGIKVAEAIIKAKSF